MMDVADSARKHGVSDDDMHHAVALAVRVVRQGSADRVLVIGPDRVGASSRSWCSIPTPSR
jgi:hypothetical protein